MLMSLVMVMVQFARCCATFLALKPQNTTYNTCHLILQAGKLAMELTYLSHS